jgi:hypothetical protein
MLGLTAWFGPQCVFSTGEAAHIFGSGPVLLPVSWIMMRVRIWENSELSESFRGCCEWLITKQSYWIQNCSQVWFTGQWCC